MVNGHFETAELLLSLGAAVDERDATGMTALLHAARSGRADLVAVLVENGANKEASNNEGETAFMLAAAHGHTAVVKFLATGMLDNAAPSLPHPADDELVAALAQVDELERAKPQLPPKNPDEWVCLNCTLVNSATRRICDVCLVARSGCASAYQTSARTADLRQQVEVGSKKSSARAVNPKFAYRPSQKEIRVAHANGTWSRKYV